MLASLASVSSADPTRCLIGCFLNSWSSRIACSHWAGWLAWLAGCFLQEEHLMPLQLPCCHGWTELQRLLTELHISTDWPGMLVHLCEHALKSQFCAHAAKNKQQNKNKCWCVNKKKIQQIINLIHNSLWFQIPPAVHYSWQINGIKSNCTTCCCAFAKKKLNTQLLFDNIHKTQLT